MAQISKSRICGFILCTPHINVECLILPQYERTENVFREVVIVYMLSALANNGNWSVCEAKLRVVYNWITYILVI